jgi:hypothetical protein
MIWPSDTWRRPLHFWCYYLCLGFYWVGVIKNVFEYNYYCPKKFEARHVSRLCNVVIDYIVHHYCIKYLFSDTPLWRGTGQVLPGKIKCAVGKSESVQNSSVWSCSWKCVQFVFKDSLVIVWYKIVFNVEI